MPTAEGQAAHRSYLVACFQLLEQRAQAVWTFTIDGYPVIKKSLDKRHTETPSRPLRSAGVSYFSELIQYIVAIPELDPVHDANYQANKASALKSLV